MLCRSLKLQTAVLFYFSVDLVARPSAIRWIRLRTSCRIIPVSETAMSQLM